MFEDEYDCNSKEETIRFALEQVLANLPSTAELEAEISDLRHSNRRLQKQVDTLEYKLSEVRKTNNLVYVIDSTGISDITKDKAYPQAYTGFISDIIGAQTDKDRIVKVVENHLSNMGYRSK
jgi:hypothetical protein